MYSDETERAVSRMLGRASSRCIDLDMALCVVVSSVLSMYVVIVGVYMTGLSF